MNFSYAYDAFYYENSVEWALQIPLPPEFSFSVEDHHETPIEATGSDSTPENNKSNLVGKSTFHKSANHPSRKKVNTDKVSKKASRPLDPQNQDPKKKAQTLSAEKWEPYKSQIIELHKKYKLQEVQRIMKKEHGFVAE